MSSPRKIDSLQIDQDTTSQRRMWKIERAGWVVFILLLTIAGLGFLGGIGPLNKASAANEHIEIEYEPFARRTLTTEFEVNIKNPSGDKTNLTLERDFLGKYEVQKITPEPSDVKASGNTITYEFNLGENTESVDVNFLLKPDLGSVGNAEGMIGTSSEGSVKIKQFIYP